MLSAYDAMRGAGLRVEDLAAFPAPAGTTTADIARDGAGHPAGTADAMEARPESCTWKRRSKARHASSRRHTPREALAQIQDFSCKLQKCKRGNRAYDLLKQLRDEIEASSSTP